MTKVLSFTLSMRLVSLAILFLNEQEGWARWLTPLSPLGGELEFKSSVDQEVKCIVEREYLNVG